MKKHIFYLSLLCIILFIIVNFAEKEKEKKEEAVNERTKAEIIPKEYTIADYQSKPAETILSNKMIEEIGMDKLFYSEKINDKVWKRIYKKSYKENCTIPKKELRYIRIPYYGFDKKTHIGELLVNKKIAKDTIAVFKELYLKKYPIERIVLIDNYNAEDEKSMSANNTSCFNFRKINGQKALSNHSRGLAIDINPLYNPCVRRMNGKKVIEPKEGREYENRSKSFPYKIEKDDICYQIFTKYGFQWGGDWNSLKDYQHFEKAN